MSWNMQYCSNCGNRTNLKYFGTHRHAGSICATCDAVHHEAKPRMLVGCIPVYNGKVLLCRRAIEPRIGYWTLPGGFMENGETSEQGAARETWEEARARVKNLEPYRLIDVPHMGQVYLFYRCVVPDGICGVGRESRSVRFFDQRELPWDELAFPLLEETLKAFFTDAATGRFTFRALTGRPYDADEPALSPMAASRRVAT